MGGLFEHTLHTGSLPLVGAPGGEIWGHAWVQWWHADALPAWPDGPGAWLPTSGAWPVIDPLPTLFAALVGAVAGPIVAWDLTAFLGVATAFVGGAVLARSQSGDPLVGGLALALAPAFLGSVASGLTEDFALGLAAVSLGWVGSPDRRRALAAGIGLGLLTTCGLVLAWASAVAAVGLGLVALYRSEHRKRTLTDLLGSAGIAALCTLPTAWQHLERLTGTGHRMGRFIARPEPLWRLNPWKGIDVASFWVPGRVDPADALVRMHPGYLGLSLLALALVAGWSRWWVVLVLAAAWSIGPHLSVAGTPTGIDNPLVDLLAALPFGTLVNHHGRLLLIGAIALSVLAARGATRLQARRGARARWIILLVVGIDLAGLGPVGAPLPIADPTPLAVYTHPSMATLPDGLILQLPAAGPGVHFQRPLLDQRAHRRPLLLDPNRPGLPPSLARTPTGQFLSSLAAPEGPVSPSSFEWPPQVALLVVAEPHIAPVAKVLGEPSLLTDDSAIWIAPR